MAWGPFSAEAVLLDSKLRKLHKDGRVSDAIGAIKEALEKARVEGPGNISYAEFEAAADVTAQQG